MTGLATTGNSVFTNVVYDVSRATAPLLIVRMGDERAESVAMGIGRAGVKLERTCQFIVEALVEDNDDADAALNDIAKEVETALATASGPWSDLYLVASVPELAQAEKVRGSLRMIYRALYYTRRDTPDQTA